jgi:hypothetical protein
MSAMSCMSATAHQAGNKNNLAAGASLINAACTLFISG